MMSHRLPLGALVLLGSSLASLAACAGGGSADDDGDPVDAREVDTASPDASSPDAPDVDASAPDAAPDAATDAGVDAVPDAAIDAMPLLGETCQMAEQINIAGGGLGTATVSGTTAAYTNHYMPPIACTSDYLQDGPDHVYSISVPAGARLTVAVTPATGFDPGIYIVGSPATMCDANPIVCLAGTDAGGSGAPDSVRYDNTTNATVSVFVVIDGTSTTGGAYMLTATVATIPPPTAGDLCGNAEAITLTNGAGTATGSTTTANGYENNYTPPAACTAGPGNDHVHSVTVPAGQRLVASVTPTTSGFDPSLYLIAGPAASCDANPIVCIAGTDNGGSNDLERLTYTNTTANPVEVFIVVDAYSATEEGNYTVSVFLGIPPGDTCQLGEMVTLTGGMATVTGTTKSASGYADNYLPPTACTSTYSQDGNDRVHIVSVPTGTTLTATVTPSGGFDAGLYLIAGPAAACDAMPIVCLAGIDGAGTNGAETVTYANTSGATVDVMTVVDSFDPSAEGDYSLTLQVQ